MGVTALTYLIVFPVMNFILGLLLFLLVYILSKFFPKKFKTLKHDEEPDERSFVYAYSPIETRKDLE